MPVKHDTIFTILESGFGECSTELKANEYRDRFPKKCGAASVGEYNRVILYYQLS